MSRPLIIYVSGAPASGKTTLAQQLSAQLYLPYVASDLIHGGARFTNKEYDRKETIQNTFVPLLVFMAEKGESFVVDNVLQEGLSKADIIDQLRPHADIVYIHTQATRPIERYVERIKKSENPNVLERREELLGRAKHHADNLPNTEKPLILGTPTLVVNTDEGYEPNLESIITFIHDCKKDL